MVLKMKQVINNLRTGKISVDEVPDPLLQEQGILVRSHVSLISTGTERMMLKLAGKSLLGKARQRPDLVQKVLDKLRREGFLATFRTIRQQLDREVPAGYSVCGEVLQVGSRAREFAVGQRVACAGAGYASHAEINYVPRLLAAAVPSTVTTEAAAYSTVGAIALQGVRNAEVRVGEAVVVIGLGLLGQLAVQILRGAGYRVVGLDLSERRVQLAGQHGAELALALRGGHVEKRVFDFTRGRGADAVLITAATSSAAPIALAAQLARERARVVMVGVTGMEIPRKSYYEKELTFVVSRSYGPGRYDPQYEEQGQDYPAGYVRWTENRNLEGFLDLVAAGCVRPDVLTTHRFPIREAEKAYEMILADREPYLGVLLTYPPIANGEAATGPVRIPLRASSQPKPVGKVGTSFIGAGNFARAVLLPNLVKLPYVQMRGVATSTGVSARSAGKKFGFAYCASSPEDILDDAETDAVFVVTRHSQHADLACKALAAGKAVFVEKPLVVTLGQLRQVRTTLQAGNPGLMVGFNRRFAPLAAKLKEHLAGCGPLTVHYRCNAGRVSPDHWLAAAEEGGRIIGEACHFLDFFAFLTDAPPRKVYAVCPGDQTNVDQAQITTEYADGSLCQLLYTSEGPSSFGKERVEAFAGGNVGVLEDFRNLYLVRSDGKRKRHRLFQADKGHAAELAAFVRAVRTGGEMPIAIDSILSTTLASLAAVASIHRRQPVDFTELESELDSRPD